MPAVEAVATLATSSWQRAGGPMQTVLGNSRWLGVIAALGAMLLFGGCAASFKGAPDRLYKADELTTLDPLYAKTIQAAASAASGAQIGVRNQFIEMRSAVIDHQYDLFRGDLYEQRIGANVGVDLATLGLSGVGAATGSTQLKTGAAALAAFLIGGKASIDKNAYFDRTLPALLEQMDAARATVRRRILDSMLLDVGNYPLMQASSDLQAYYHAGTIPGAIAGITTTAATQKKAAFDDLDRRLSGNEMKVLLKARGYDAQVAAASDSGSRLERCFEAKDVSPRPNEAVLLAWLKKEKFTEPFGAAAFVTLPKYEVLRQKALVDTDLQAKLAGCLKP